MSRESWPISFSWLLNKTGEDFLDTASPLLCFFCIRALCPSMLSVVAVCCLFIVLISTNNCIYMHILHLQTVKGHSQGFHGITFIHVFYYKIIFFCKYLKNKFSPLLFFLNPYGVFLNLDLKNAFDFPQHFCHYQIMVLHVCLKIFLNLIILLIPFQIIRFFPLYNRNICPANGQIW